VLQTTLLRALESRRVRRTGGTREVPVDVRLIAATTRPASAPTAAASKMRLDSRARMKARSRCGTSNSINDLRRLHLARS